MNMNSIKKFFKIFSDSFKQKSAYIPAYRVIEISQNDENEYIAKIQIINKNLTFKAQPEEILAKDTIVDQFSPRDIRTLTYLGYLGINNPKYKILAKRLSENDKKIIFALKKKGQKKAIIKTANQIIQEKDIIDNLDSKDARLIGYALGSENTAYENLQKQQLLEENNKRKKHDEC